MATSTVTPDRSTDDGWLKQFTTHPEMATWVNKKSNFLSVFGLYTQGDSMKKAIEMANEEPKKRKRSTKGQRSDVIKVHLGQVLCALTSKWLFLSHSFLMLSLKLFSLSDSLSS